MKKKKNPLPLPLHFTHYNWVKNGYLRYLITHMREMCESYNTKSAAGTFVISGVTYYITHDDIPAIQAFIDANPDNEYIPQAVRERCIEKWRAEISANKRRERRSAHAQLELTLA